MTGVIFFVAAAISFLSLALILPVGLALATSSDLATVNLSILAVLSIFASTLVLAAVSERVHGMNRVQSLLAVVVLWLLVPIVGSLPFVVTGTTPLGTALFEAYSGLTTTGATTFVNPADLPLPLRFWRSELEWIGGFFTLVCVLHILAPAGIGGMPRAGGRFVRGEQELTAHLDLVRLRSLFMQYLLITIMIALFLVLTGLDAITALMLAMLAISTGGFVPLEQPLDLAIGQGAVLVMAIGFALGATCLFWQNYSLKDFRGFVRRNQEAIWIFRIIAVLAAIYGFLLHGAAGTTGLWGAFTALNEGFFTAASLVSTSGVQTRAGVIGLLPSLLVVYIILNGASIFSTSSGIKLYRIAGMFVQARRELELLVYPSSVGTMRISGVPMDQKSARMAWTVFVLATATIVGSAFLICALDADFEAAFIASVALFSNAGPVYTALIPLGADVASWPTYADLSGLAMFGAVLTMLLGRLEVLVVLAAFNFAYWVNR